MAAEGDKQPDAHQHTLRISSRFGRQCSVEATEQPWYSAPWKVQNSHDTVLCGSYRTAMTQCSVEAKGQPWYSALWKPQNSHDGAQWQLQNSHYTGLCEGYRTTMIQSSVEAKERPWQRTTWRLQNSHDTRLCEGYRTAMTPGCVKATEQPWHRALWRLQNSHDIALCEGYRTAMTQCSVKATIQVYLSFVKTKKTQPPPNPPIQTNQKTQTHPPPPPPTPNHHNKTNPNKHTHKNQPNKNGFFSQCYHTFSILILETDTCQTRSSPPFTKYVEKKLLHSWKKNMHMVAGSGHRKQQRDRETSGWPGLVDVNTRRSKYQVILYFTTPNIDLQVFMVLPHCYVTGVGRSSERCHRMPNPFNYKTSTIGPQNYLTKVMQLVFYSVKCQ